MGKKIPKKITPDSIVTAVLEIRFSLKIDPTELFSKLYPKLIDTYPKLDQKKHPIPAEIMAIDPQFKYLTDFTFSNTDFAVSIGPSVIVFEYLARYTGWDDFSKNFASVLSSFDDLDIFKSTERIGLRYINIIEDATHLESIIEPSITLGLKDKEERNVAIRSELVNDKIVSVVNISQNAQIKRKQSVIKGILVDIDAATTENLPLPTSSLIKQINTLHEEEKFIFFTLLKQSFIDSKKPVY